MRLRRGRLDAKALARYLELPAGQRRHAVEASCAGVLEANWTAQPPFTAPNRRRYPWMWLWDSCFHAVAWSGLGDPRAVTELETLLSLQLPSGFIPHMGYLTRPQASLGMWHAPGRSDITQPPMYGHALRVLAGRGFAVEHLHARARAGLDYLFSHRRDPDSGLIRVLHPWETGADDSPRWDEPARGRFNERRWNSAKRALARSIVLREGAAWANPGFEVASAGFSALVAFNARELGELTGDERLLSQASVLAEAIDGRWVQERRTWGDVRLAGPQRSPEARTLDGLLAVLVSPSRPLLDAAFAEIFEPRSFWRAHGPSGTAAEEPSYDPGAYWRGDAWPPLLYLVMVAARRLGRREEARLLAHRLVLGCIGSGFSERWNPETGAGLGAAPQGWAALAGEGLRVLEGRDTNATS